MIARVAVLGMPILAFAVALPACLLPGPAPATPGVVAPPECEVNTAPAPATIPIPGTLERPARKLQPPQIISQVCPSFPDAAMGGKTEVVVTMKASIDEAGIVREATVVGSAGPDIDPIAVQAMLGFRFAPARFDNRPIKVILPFRFVFRRRETLAGAAHPRG